MKIGVIAGNFDVIHPGYIKMFKECKENCDNFTVLLHSDPSIERSEKLSPILSVEERDEILYSIKYIDNIFIYDTEQELLNLLNIIRPQVRFLGDDYKGKKFTGDNLNIPIHYLDRSHGWSTTKFKVLITKSVVSML
jgi:glycerol-3-phosphate cytidylyltransferase